MHHHHLSRSATEDMVKMQSNENQEVTSVFPFFFSWTNERTKFFFIANSKERGMNDKSLRDIVSIGWKYFAQTSTKFLRKGWEEEVERNEVMGKLINLSIILVPRPLSDILSISSFHVITAPNSTSFPLPFLLPRANIHPSTRVNNCNILQLLVIFPETEL